MGRREVRGGKGWGEEGPQVCPEKWEPEWETGVSLPVP